MFEKRPDPVSLRFPIELREKLDHVAKKSGRSLNSEIRMRLEWSFAAEVDFTKHEAERDARSERAAQRILRANLTNRPDPIEERFKELEARVAKLEKE